MKSENFILKICKDNNFFKILFILNFILASLYIFNIKPFALEPSLDELEHFYRTIGQLGNSSLIDEKYFYFIFPKVNLQGNLIINDAFKLPIYKILLHKYYWGNEIEKTKYLSVSLLNIQAYYFFTYIIQKISFIITSSITNNIYYIYIFTRFTILLINFLLIYSIVKKIESLTIKYYLNCILSLPSILILLGSYNQDTTLIILTLFSIFLSLKKTLTNIEIFLLYLSIFLVGVTKIPYAFFLIFPLILVKRNYINYIFFVISVISIVGFTYYSFNSFELIKREGVNLTTNIIFLKDNILMLPQYLAEHFIKNIWNYSATTVGYLYRPISFLDFKLKFIHHIYLVPFQIFALYLLFKNFERKKIIYLIIFFISLCAVCLSIYTALCYPWEIIEIPGVNGRYFLINLLWLFPYFKEKKKFKSFLSTYHKIFLILFSVIFNSINILVVIYYL
jgi:hypothetical protein